MRKYFFLILVFFATFTTANAQVRGIANHLGAGVGIGTEGINISAATCFTDFVEAELGVNFMPGFGVTKNAHVHFTGSGGASHPNSGVDVKASLARTTFDFKASVYPFGMVNSFFVTAGLSFGGQKIVKMSGTDYDRTITDGEKPYIMVGSKQVDLLKGDDGYYHLDADARVNSVRPYVGVGYGRLIPKGRLGFRVELGCQFHGTAKIYANGDEMKVEDAANKDEDVQKIIDKLTVYPVLKFSIRGKIL